MPWYKPHSDALRLAQLLCRVGLGAKRAVEGRIAGARLSYIQYELLLEVEDNPGIHLREAARRAGWSGQVMVVAARDLAKRGLVSLEPRAQSAIPTTRDRDWSAGFDGRANSASPWPTHQALPGY